MLNLAVPLIAAQGFGSIRVEECAVRAKDLSDKLHGSQIRFAAQRVAWNSSLMRQRVARTVALAKDLVGFAKEDWSPAKLAVAHRALGYSLMLRANSERPSKSLSEGRRWPTQSRQANLQFMASIQARSAEGKVGS